MKAENLPDGLVYTETVVHTAPERYVSEAPYQIAIVDMPGHGRRTVRILTHSPDVRANIGDRVSFVEWRDGVACFAVAENRPNRPR